MAPLMGAHVLPAGEAHERFEVVLIGLAKGGEIVGAGVAFCLEFDAASPGEWGAAEGDGEAISQETGVATVAVSPRMDRDQAVVHSHAEFVGGEGLVFDPRAGIRHQ